MDRSGNHAADHSGHGAVQTASNTVYNADAQSDIHSPYSGTDSTGSHSTWLHGGANEELLFQGLVTSSTGGFILACVVFCVLTFALEIARYYTYRIEMKLQRHLQELKNKKCKCPDYDTFPPMDLQQSNGSSQNVQEPPNSNDLRDHSHKSGFFSASGTILLIVTGFGHFTSYFFGLIFMLVAMTYNIYLILSLCLGNACGKLFIVYLKYRTT